MTLANRITVLRLALTPLFVLLIISYTPDEPWRRLTAMAVFFLAALTDGLDGYVARNYDQRTRLGAVLDPLADKLMLNLGFLFLAANEHFGGAVPKWVPVLILGRDVIIVLGACAINEWFGGFRAHPRITGKLTTAFQMLAIVSVLLGARFAHLLVMAAAAATAISLLDYLFAGVRMAAKTGEA